MQLRNIEPFSQYVPGDVVEVPDGAQFDPFHWEAAAQEHPGTGEEMHGIEHPADGTMSPPVSNDAPAAAAVPVQFLNPDPKEM